METQIQQRNILVIEDDQELNEAIVLALENDTYTFIQCRTIADARKIMESRDISLILLDLSLPDDSGIDFVREIRKRSQLPILLIAVSSMEPDIEAGLEAGANDYITKPFRLTALRERVAGCAGKQRPKSILKSTILTLILGKWSFAAPVS